MIKRDKAIIVGFNQFGGVIQLSRLLEHRGYHDIVGLVNKPEIIDVGDAPSCLRLVRVDTPLNPTVLRRVASDYGAAEPNTPFLCAQDRAMLPYVKAWRELRSSAGETLHVPCDGITRARVKPLARELWNLSGVDATEWTVATGQDWTVDRLSGGGTLLQFARDREYVVKPVAGMASEAVKVCLGSDIEQCVAEVRAFLSVQPVSSESGPEGTVVTDTINGIRRKYSLFTDVLIEEKLPGNEYTVDGYVVGGSVCVAVQQKEYRIIKPFFGDGLIVSPPSTDELQADVESPSVAHAGTCHTRPGAFEALLERGLAALGLDNWVFHAEIMETPNNELRFVELNPRPAGGLLWLTAGVHVGQDPYEIMLKMHLRHDVLTKRSGWVTGQFPVYAKRAGKISHVKGIEEARNISGVIKVVQVARKGDEIVSLEKENYLAFVSIYAATHDDVRRIAREVADVIDIE